MRTSEYDAARAVLLACALAAIACNKEPATTSSTSTASPATDTPGATSPAGPTPKGPSAAATGPCTKCATQEDFDAAQKKGGSCCPVVACAGDDQCSGGRVCCKIPNGQLC